MNLGWDCTQNVWKVLSAKERREFITPAWQPWGELCSISSPSPGRAPPKCVGALGSQCLSQDLIRPRGNRKAALRWIAVHQKPDILTEQVLRVCFAGTVQEQICRESHHCSNVLTICDIIVRYYNFFYLIKTWYFYFHVNQSIIKCVMPTQNCLMGLNKVQHPLSLNLNEWRKTIKITTHPSRNYSDTLIKNKYSPMYGSHKEKEV